jgi:acetate kinase
MLEVDTMEKILQFIAKLPLFEGFSAKTLEELIDNCYFRSYVPGETIIQMGQRGRFLGIMVRGEAEAFIPSRSGKRIKIGEIKQGSFLGEISLLTGEPTNADVVAVKACELLMIPPDSFTKYIAINPQAVSVMAKAITERLRARQNNEEEQMRVESAWKSVPDPYGLGLTAQIRKRILVINCGSSSLKYNYFDTERPSENSAGIVERIGLEKARIVSKRGSEKKIRELGRIGYEEAFKSVIDSLTDPEKGIIEDMGKIDAVGHRVVHGGEKYRHPVVIDEDVIKDIDEFSRLAPLHNPPNLMAIEESIRLMPEVPQVAVFDTGFHQKMPRHAHLYGLPFEYYEEDQIRRYGFHGISHNYVALQSAAYLKRNFREMKIISCHLGNGASVCAVDHGRSVDTTMGLTPLEGLVMGTRCGDADPSIAIHLLREKGLSLDRVDEILNRESGLKGLSGISSDFREIEEEANKGDERALTAIHVFCYRIRKYIGAYTAALGGVDAVVFTGGIGEGSAWVRGLSCQGLETMGIHLDTFMNKKTPDSSDEIREISEEDSPSKVLVIPTDEGRMIARETLRALEHEGASELIKIKKERKIPLEVSAHHVHLSKDDIHTLFGPGKALTHRSDLSQPGQFACEETVNLIGPKGRVERVRVLGPARRETQVEISMTEEFKLGVKAPIRASGVLKGSPGITLEGPAGKARIPHGVVCSLRHIHMSPEDALSFGVRDRDIVSVHVEGERKLIFGDVLVRVHPDFRLSMHIDTDEANAANIQTGMSGILVGVQDRR